METFLIPTYGCKATHTKVVIYPHKIVSVNLAFISSWMLLFHQYMMLSLSWSKVIYLYICSIYLSSRWFLNGGVYNENRGSLGHVLTITSLLSMKWILVCSDVRRDINVISSQILYSSALDQADNVGRQSKMYVKVSPSPLVEPLPLLEIKWLNIMNQ